MEMLKDGDRTRTEADNGFCHGGHVKEGKMSSKRVQPAARARPRTAWNAAQCKLINFLKTG